MAEQSLHSPDDQQLAASGILGFTTNIPDATDCVLMQGPNLGVVSGSMQRILTANQMPRHFHQAASITNDQGKHGIYDVSLNGGVRSERIRLPHGMVRLKLSMCEQPERY